MFTLCPFGRRCAETWTNLAAGDMNWQRPFLKLWRPEKMGDVPNWFLSFLAGMTSVISCLAVSSFLHLWHTGDRNRMVFSALWKEGWEGEVTSAISL